MPPSAVLVLSALVFITTSYASVINQRRALSEYIEAQVEVNTVLTAFHDWSTLSLPSVTAQSEWSAYLSALPSELASDLDHWVHSSAAAHAHDSESSNSAPVKGAFVGVGQRLIWGLLVSVAALIAWLALVL